ADDPEAHDDLWLAPTHHLEVMVERRAPENPMGLRVLEPEPPPTVLENNTLEDDGNHFRHEYGADEGEHELGLEQDRHRAERSAERQRAGVAHEDLRRMRVVPKESDQGADHRQAEHRQLAGIGEEEHAEVIAQDAIADDIGENRKG